MLAFVPHLRPQLLDLYLLQLSCQLALSRGRDRVKAE